MCIYIKNIGDLHTYCVERKQIHITYTADSTYLNLVFMLVLSSF